jgi:hypothetical protein
MRDITFTSGTSWGTWLCRFPWSTRSSFYDLPFICVMFNETANSAMCGADNEASRGVSCFPNDTPFLSTYVNIASFTTIKLRPSPNPLSQSWQLHIINTELRSRRGIKVGFFCVLEQSGTVTEPICTKLGLLDKCAWRTPNLNFMNIRQDDLVCFSSLHADGRTNVVLT